MIKINKWWDQFENAGSRKLVNIRHFSSTSGNDSRGYRKLMRMGSKGLTAFGAFQALCQLLAGLGIEARKAGQMVNSDGSHLDILDLSDLTHISTDILERNIEALVGIGWVERLQPLEVKESATNLPSSANDLPPISQDPPNGEEGIGEERRGGNVLAEPQAIAWTSAGKWGFITLDDMQSWSKAYPACDLEKQLERMHQWLLSNPSKAKRKLWRKFITNWLSSQQDRGGDTKSNRPQPALGQPNMDKWSSAM